MWPHGCRILHQIGCLDALKDAAIPITEFLCRGPNSKLIQDSGLYRARRGESEFFSFSFSAWHLSPLTSAHSHGIGFFPIERRQFLQILYDGLPDKSFIKTNCRVEDVKQDSKGVEVRLTNGTVEYGDMVLGVDGVHSHIRSIMWEHATRSVPGMIKAKREDMYVLRDPSCLIALRGVRP